MRVSRRLLVRLALLAAASFVVACGGDRATDVDAATPGRDVGFGALPCTGGTLVAGGSFVAECRIERLPDADRWWYAPLFFESAPVCPVPEETEHISGPHRVLTFDVPSDVLVDATLERPGSDGSVGDTFFAFYLGRGAPTSEVAARACLGIEAASGPFAGEIHDVALDAGSVVTVVVWNLPSEGPTDFRLTVATRSR